MKTLVKSKIDKSRFDRYTVIMNDFIGRDEELFAVSDSLIEQNLEAYTELAS